MDWYYAENGERRGPVSDAEFQRLVQTRALAPETQVWRPGWSDWRALREAVPETASEPGTAACRECGRSFPVSEMVQYGGAYVCATCKPTFFQKVREGIEPSAEMVYGGFWIRFLAKVIDGVILYAVGYVAQLPFAGMLRDPHRAMIGFLFTWLTGFLLRMAYSVSLTGKFGATVGKMACGLRVVRADGTPVGYALAFGRFFAETLSGLILCIGYIMAAFDDQKRTLHDRICNTRVIRPNA